MDQKDVGMSERAKFKVAPQVHVPRQGWKQKWKPWVVDAIDEADALDAFAAVLGWGDYRAMEDGMAWGEGFRLKASRL